MRLRTTIVLVLTAALALGAQGGALAHHDDDSSDGSRCDSWYRAGHEAESEPTTKDTHDHAGNQTNVGPAQIHNHGGHYVVRSDQGYVEIVGGQGYDNNDGNQGGYVQGEVDPDGSGPDADFHFSSFAGENPDFAEAHACATVANIKVGDQGSPPS